VAFLECGSVPPPWFGEGCFAGRAAAFIGFPSLSESIWLIRDDSRREMGSLRLAEIADEDLGFFPGI
jgi:hypothetical protein